MPTYSGSELYLNRDSIEILVEAAPLHIYPTIQIYSDDSNIYVLSLTNLLIYDIATNLLGAYISYPTIAYPDGFTSITGNSSHVYLGTSDNGVIRFSKSCMVLDIAVPNNIELCLTDYLTSPYIEGNNVNYVHGNDSFLGVISTSSSGMGAGIIGLSEVINSRTTTSDSYFEKCFITTSGSLYYTVSGVGGWEIDVQLDNSSDWQEPSHKYINGAGQIPEGQKTTDIFVT